MFNIFKKKEKPLRTFSLMEICEKTFDTEAFGYLPQQLTYYADRVVLSVDRVDQETLELEHFTISIPQTGERLLPFEIDGVQLFWDTADHAFRMKRLPEGKPMAILPEILLYPNDVLAITKDFAEAKLSPMARSYATLVENHYLWYCPDGSAAPVVFELPRAFEPFSRVEGHPLNNFCMSVTNNLSTYTPSYVAAIGMTANNYLHLYAENGKKEL